RPRPRVPQPVGSPRLHAARAPAARAGRGGDGRLRALVPAGARRGRDRGGDRHAPRRRGAARRGRRARAARPRGPPPGARAAVVATGLVVAGGALRLALASAGGPVAVPVTVVQSNVQPAFHWTRPYADALLQRHVGMTRDAALPGGLVVWPENSIALYLDQE